nr:MAG TPA: hypothetical protein [Bacteriophage sp.]
MTFNGVEIDANNILTPLRGRDAMMMQKLKRDD